MQILWLTLVTIAAVLNFLYKKGMEVIAQEQCDQEIYLAENPPLTAAQEAEMKRRTRQSRRDRARSKKNRINNLKAQLKGRYGNKYFTSRAGKAALKVISQYNNLRLDKIERKFKVQPGKADAFWTGLVIPNKKKAVVAAATAGTAGTTVWASDDWDDFWDSNLSDNLFSGDSTTPNVGTVINPATGCPMMSGSMAGFDACGNTYGSSDSGFDDDGGIFDDDSFGSSIDDSAFGGFGSGFDGSFGDCGMDDSFSDISCGIDDY